MIRPKAKSALDLANYSPIPGTHGRLVADGNKLRYACDPAGTSRTFVGTNLTGFACFPRDKDEAEKWAQTLRVMGYSAVRFHHIDWVIRDHGWGIKDRADMFVRALKRRGILVLIDLFSTRSHDLNFFKWAVIYDQFGVRNDWRQYAETLLTRPSSVEGVLPWAQEPAIAGVCPLNEDDPRFLNAAPAGSKPRAEAYKDAYAWMESVTRATGYEGMFWGLNSGVDPEFKPAYDGFSVEDFHTYWDHPWGTQYLDTSGAHQWWQMYGRSAPEKPLICTEWGSLAPNRFRGETGLFFAAESVRRGTRMALSYALATNEWGMNGGNGGSIDMFQFWSDPVRVTTERAMVLMMRAGAVQSHHWQNGEYATRFERAAVWISGNNRGRDGMPFGVRDRAALFLGSLDGKPLDESGRLLLISLGDAWNTGLHSSPGSPDLVRVNTSFGTAPVKTLVRTPDVHVFGSQANFTAYAIDTFTGNRWREVRSDRHDGGFVVRPESFCTEIVRS